MHVTFFVIYLANKFTGSHFANHSLLVFCLNEFYLYKLNEFSRVKMGQSLMNQIIWGYSHYVGERKLAIKIHIIFGEHVVGVIQLIRLSKTQQLISFFTKKLSILIDFFMKNSHIQFLLFIT